MKLILVFIALVSLNAMACESCFSVGDFPSYADEFRNSSVLKEEITKFEQQNDVYCKEGRVTAVIGYSNKMTFRTKCQNEYKGFKLKVIGRVTKGRFSIEEVSSTWKAPRI